MKKFGFEVLGQCTPNKPKGKFVSLENPDEAGKKIDLNHHPVFKISVTTKRDHIVFIICVNFSRPLDDNSSVNYNGTITSRSNYHGAVGSSSELACLHHASLWPDKVPASVQPTLITRLRNTLNAVTECGGSG